VDQARVGDLILREVVEPLHLGVEVLERQEARQLGDLDGEAHLLVFRVGVATDEQRRALLRLELTLHRRELLGLVVRQEAGAEVATDDLEGDEHRGHGQPQHEGFPHVL
jgi:hypothetical protein